MDISELEENAVLTAISGIIDENTFSILNDEREEEFIKLVNIEAPDKDDLGYGQVAVDAISADTRNFIYLEKVSA